MANETLERVKEIQRLLALAEQLPKTDVVKEQWVKVAQLMAAYIETQIPIIEAEEELNKKWLVTSVALQSFLTDFIKAKKNQKGDKQ